MKPSAFLLRLGCLVLITGPSFTKAETAEFSGTVTLHSLNGPPVAGTLVSAPGSPSSVTGPKGRFSKIRPQASPAQWLEVKAVKIDHGVVNALDLRRPLPVTGPRTLNVILAATGEVSDRAAQHWKQQVHERWHTPKGAPRVTADEIEKPLKSLAACYGEWLSGLSPNDLSLRWSRAFRQWMDNMPGQALGELPLSVLTAEADPEESLRMQHLRLMILLSLGKLKPAAAEAEQAAATHPQSGLIKFTLAHLQARAKNSAAAQKTFESLALQPEIPPLLRLRSLSSLAEIHFSEGSYEKVIVHFQQAVAVYANASTKNLSYTERGGLATAKMNLSMALWQLQPDSADLRPHLNDALALHRQSYALYPDLHAMFLSDALDTAASITTLQKVYSQAETLFLERADLHRTQAQTQPAQHLPLLAKTLERLSKVAQIQSRHDLVIQYATEAFEVLGSLSQPREAEGHLPLAAQVLARMGDAHFATQNYTEAQSAYKKAAPLYQELVRISPGTAAHHKELAMTWEKLAHSHFESKELFAATQAYARAGELHSRLVTQGDETHVPNAFHCLNNVTGLLFNAKQHKEALRSGLLTLQLAEKIESRHPELHVMLAEISMSTSLLLAKEDRKAEAIPLMHQAIRLYRAAREKTPAQHAVRLGIALVTLSEFVDKKEAGPLLDEAEALLQDDQQGPEADALRESLRQAAAKDGKVTL